MAEKKISAKNSSNLGAGIAMGVGLVAAAAGGYFLYGPQGKANRKKVKAWGIKARGEVLHELEKMKDVSADKYNETVEKVMAKYGKVKGVSVEEVVELGGELKRYWKKISADLKKQTGAVKKKSNTVRKLVAKKIAPKN
ncbi:MAG: hypothetical protein A2571_02325 [Candidatus Vogelbacteria bacterium RIFOXYD1_FULL_44_32]|uniref:Uncharacterized protein n=1 Tax=Candidatus Vogelbacteria bacterium RIFOXYD1_FULL_44_32 TaxID=1802438 RepID=A0A1G2QDV3_9BACT|nr:MAG: hypothetical protein A2571_02325 [Candidatus Vogelbacteria bacterium RIFOXYD1_FULL_44_32]